MTSGDRGSPMRATKRPLLTLLKQARAYGLGLVLASQGGARAKVTPIALEALSAKRADRGAFRADATWTVSGSVGHWGHVHQRRNRVRAELWVAPVDGNWKLIDLELIEEERL